ncbi:MAG: hypothetical protein V4484_15560 [Pseudomonadota bacterium]
MIVPAYWAEARQQYRRAGKQITVRRFGWSDDSVQDAQANAEQRASEALARAVAGEALPRREPKLPYNGAQGVPIREQIVAREGSAIITRNAYGARCLNTPDVLFADIDFALPFNGGLLLGVVLLLLAGAAAVWCLSGMRWLGILLAVLSLLFGATLAGALQRLVQTLRGGAQAVALGRVHQFAARHPDWHLRIYRTPAGLRVLAMQRLFDPRENAVAECFAALGTDPVYVAMCKNQHCFRARLSAKPWRIGIAGHLRPRPGVWPVAPERMPARQAWLDNYERVAAGYAACVFVEAIGSAVTDPQARLVQQLHDAQCQAGSTLPLA